MMKRTQWVVIFSSLNPTDVYLIQSVLKEAEIPSQIKGALRSALAGEVPMDDARVELLVEASLSKIATTLIDEQLHTNRPDWQCTQCGEINPGNFQHCWQCGLNRIHPHEAEKSSGN